LQDSSTQKKYCAWICTPGRDPRFHQCGTNASCKSIQGTGICTYDDDAKDRRQLEITPAARDYTNYDFQAYLAEFGKSYIGEEHETRKALFEKNMELIQKHNEQYKAGEHTWWAGVNHLTDYTKEEFARLRSTKYNPSTHPTVQLTSSGANPDSVDWRTKNMVTPVKNQGGCGSCWAFSATETVESAYAMATGKLLTLAPQYYVNCVKNPNSCGGTGGCEGATMELAFNQSAIAGMPLESTLPYSGRDGQCGTYKAAVKVTGYVKNPVNDAAALETAVAQKGPMAITVAAEPWQMYGGGLFKGCSSGLFGSNTLDHGVQLVGYTKDYWIVRNSWGASWGEKGYIRVSRANDDKTFTDKSPADGVACKPYPKTQTVGGECGILFDTSYPTGASAPSDTVVV
jgi:cathepsin L